MNAKRRRQIAKVVTEIEALQQEIESILSDEQEYRDNVPEQFEFGQNVEVSDHAIDHLEQIDSPLEEVVEYLKEAKGQ